MYGACSVLHACACISEQNIPVQFKIFCNAIHVGVLWTFLILGHMVD